MNPSHNPASQPQENPRGPRSEEDSERDATRLQSPVVGQDDRPPGDDGGTRTRKGSNYGDWVPDRREPDHPDIRHPEELPLTPPPEGVSPLQGEFERTDDDPLVK